MKRLCRAGALVLGLGAMCAWPAPARADSAGVARDVVVVDVDAHAGGVDAARLRQAIGEELGADAVAPGDSRAPGARGTVTVSIDRAARALVVSYREKAGPIVRTIDLPADPDAALRAAVLLAGNLARDEASELADMLRKKTPAATAAAAGAADPELESGDDPGNDPAAERDVEQMGLTLSRYADDRRTLRTAFGLAAMGVGLGMESACFYSSWQGKNNACLVLLGTGLSMVTVGAQAFTNGRLDVLRRYYERDRASGRPSWMVRDDLEAMWLSSARSERRWRLIGGWVGIAGFGTELVLFGVLAAETHSLEVTMASFYVGLGGALLGPAIVMLSGPGATEASLRSYERATGRSVWRDRAASIAPTLSPAPGGGGVVGVVGRF
jgi:hypothetical protein